MTTALTAAQRTLYTTRLTAAEEAYHNLMLGGQARVVVDQNGERVEFTATNSARLRSYILELKALLGQSTGVNGPLQAWMM